MTESGVSMFKFGKTIAVTVFYSCVLLVQPAPTSNSIAASTASIVITPEKISCIQRDSAAKTDWKTCVKPNPENPNVPSYDELSIANYIRMNKFYEMQVPNK